MKCQPHKRGSNQQDENEAYLAFAWHGVDYFRFGARRQSFAGQAGAGTVPRHHRFSIRVNPHRQPAAV